MRSDIKREYFETAVIIIVVLLFSALIYVFYKDFEVFLERVITGNPVLFYFGIFLLCFIGAVSVIAPIPYTSFLFLLFAAYPGKINLILASILGGTGSAIGELIGWIIGKQMRKPLKEKYKRRIDSLLRLATSYGEWGIYLLIFLFALTPLPDDILFIALGLANYPLIRALLACAPGKVLMIGILGVVGERIGELGMPPEFVIILTVALLLFILALMLLINWEEILEKRLYRGNSKLS